MHVQEITKYENEVKQLEEDIKRLKTRIVELEGALGMFCIAGSAACMLGQDLSRADNA